MINKIHIHLFLILLFSFYLVIGQAQMQHELVLIVDAAEPNTTPSHSFSIRSKTIIIENSPANRFTVWADVGDSILWEAAAGESNKTVNIVGINYISGPRIFSSDTLTGKSTVKATIIRGGKEDYVYKMLYTIGSEARVYEVIAAIKIKI